MQSLSRETIAGTPSSLKTGSAQSTGNCENCEDCYRKTVPAEVAVAMGSNDRHIRVFFYCRKCTQNFIDGYSQRIIKFFVDENDASRVYPIDEYMIREL